jgi:hypothetical protein
VVLLIGWWQLPKKWLLLEGTCHTKRKQSGKDSNGAYCPDSGYTWWNTGHLLKECWMRTTTVAFSTGQEAKGGSSRDWERVNWVDNSLARLDNSMDRAVGLGKQNETLQSNSDFLPNYSSTAWLHVYSIWAVAAGYILSTLFGTKWSCQLLWLERESLSRNCLSLWRALFCQLERMPSSSHASLLSGGSPLLWRHHVHSGHVGVQSCSECTLQQVVQSSQV